MFFSNWTKVHFLSIYYQRFPLFLMEFLRWQCRKQSVRSFTEIIILGNFAHQSSEFFLFSYMRKREKRIQLVGPFASCANIIVHKPHILKKKTVARYPARKKEKPSSATSCNIYPGWLLNGSLTVTQGPRNLWEGADVFAAPDAEQMRATFSDCFWLAVGGYGECLPLKVETLYPFLASRSIKIFTERCRLEI